MDRCIFQSVSAWNSVTDIPSLQKEHMLAFAVGIWGRSDGLGTSSCFSCVKCSQHNETKAFMNMQIEKGFEIHQCLRLHNLWSRESSWGGHYVWKAIFTAGIDNNGTCGTVFKMVWVPGWNIIARTYLRLPLRQWQCLPLSVVQLKGKHCRKPHSRNGVVDTFGHWGFESKIKVTFYFRYK